MNRSQADLEAAHGWDLDAGVPSPDSAELRQILVAAEHAPKDPRSPIAAELHGWWTPEGWYVCARDAGRIMDRGCALPKGSTPAWRGEPYGVCCVCEAPE